MTDGWSVKPIGDIIRRTLDTFSTSLLVSSAGGFDGRFARFSVALSGSSVNDREILYDTINNIWLPPSTNAYSSYTGYEQSGGLTLLGGSPTDSTIYQLEQLSGYDESWNAGHDGTVHTAIDAYGTWVTDLNNNDLVKKIKKCFTQFETEGDYPVYFGISDIKYNSFTDIPISLDSGAIAWGGTGTTWGTSGPWGGPDIVDTWVKPQATSKKARLFLFRIRNSTVDQTFRHLLTTVHYTLKRALK